MQVHQKMAEPWRVTLVDTGDDTMTGGRLRRVKDYVKHDDIFCFTYGDGVANIDITTELQFHRNNRRLATITAVQPPGRYGALLRNENEVLGFQEKPPGDGAWVNGGFFVLNPTVIDFIEGDETLWEGSPLKHLVKIGQLGAFEHRGFWQPMDTLRDKVYLEQLWAEGTAPWKCWK